MGKKRKDRKHPEYLARKFVDRKVLVRLSNGQYEKGVCKKTAHGLVAGRLENGSEFCVSSKHVQRID